MRSATFLRNAPGWVSLLFALACFGSAASPAPGQEAAPALTFASPDGSRAMESTERLSVVLPPGTEERTVRVVFSVDGRRVCVAEAAPFECSWDFGSDGQARVIRAVAEMDDDTRLVARVHTPMRMSIRFRTSVERVMVPAVVTDRDGRYLAELPAERFVVLEDGAPQDISYFEAPAERSQLDLAIAIDISGSMAPVMPGLKTSVKALLASLRPDDMVTLLAFNERTFLLSRQEPDRTQLATLIDELQPSGLTSLYDAIVRALDALDESNPRKAVLAFTDGEDRSSFRSPESVEQRVLDTGAPLYVVTLGPNSETDEIVETVQRLAAVSGGEVFRADEPDELDRALAVFRDNVSNAYFLGYSPGDNASEEAALDEQFRRISVRIRNSDGYRVRARAGYRR